jgi:hypothetical protein
LKFLSYKWCFLLALASGRRRSEVHAFSTCNFCLRFSRDKSSGTLLFWNKSPFDSVVFHFDDFNYGRRSQPYFFLTIATQLGFFS